MKHSPRFRGLFAVRIWLPSFSNAGRIDLRHSELLGVIALTSAYGRRGEGIPL
jgi:hypothetical protein